MAELANDAVRYHREVATAQADVTMQALRKSAPKWARFVVLGHQCPANWFKRGFFASTYASADKFRNRWSGEFWFL